MRVVGQKLQARHISKRIAMALATGFVASVFWGGTTVFADSPDGDLELKNQGGLKAQDAWTNIKYIETNGDNQMVAFLKGLTVQATKGDFLFQNPNAQGIRTRNNTKVVIEAKKNIVMKGYLHSTHKGEVDFAADEGDITLLGEVNLPGQPIPAWISGSQMNVNAMHGSTTVNGVFLAKDTAFISFQSAKSNTFDKPLVNARSDGGAYVYVKSATGDNTFHGFLYDNDVKNYDTMVGNHQFNSREYNGKEVPVTAAGAVTIEGNNNIFNNWTAENIGTTDNATQFYNANNGDVGIRLTEGGVVNITATTGSNTVNGTILVNPSVNLTMKAVTTNTINETVMVGNDATSMATTTQNITAANPTNANAKQALVTFDAKQGNTFKKDLLVGSDVATVNNEALTNTVVVDSHESKTVVEGNVLVGGKNNTLTLHSTNADGDANKLTTVTGALGGEATFNALSGGNTIDTIQANTKSQIHMNAGAQGNTVNTAIHAQEGTVSLSAQQGSNTVKGAITSNNKGSVTLTTDAATGNTVASISTNGGKVNLQADAGVNTVTGAITAVNGQNPVSEANTAENSDIVLNAKTNDIQGNVEATNTGYVWLGTTDGNAVKAPVTMNTNGKVVVFAKQGTNTVEGPVTVGTDGNAEDKAAFTVTNEQGNNTINNVTVQGGGTATITGANNVVNANAEVQTKTGATTKITGNKSNTVDGKLTTDAGTLTVTAKAENNVINGTVETKNNGKATFTTSAGANTIGANAEVKTEAGSTTNLTGQTGNTIDGKLTVNGGTATVTATTGANTIDGTVTTTNKGETTFTAGDGKNVINKTLTASQEGNITMNGETTVAATGTAEATDKGTITMNGPTEVAGTITASKEGTVTMNESAKITGTAESTDKGTITMNGPTEVVGTVTASKEGTVTMNESAKITGTAEATGKGSSITTSGPTEVAGTVTASQEGLITLNGANTVTGTVEAVQKGTVTLKGQNTITGATLTTKTEGVINLEGQSNVTGNISATEAGTLNFTYDAGSTMNGAVTADGGTVNMQPAIENEAIKPNASIQVTGDASAKNGGNMNILLTPNSSWHGAITNNEGATDESGAPIAKGTVHLTLQGDHFFIDPVTGEDKHPVDPSDPEKELDPLKPMKGRISGATWIANNDPANRTFSSIDVLDGMGVIRGENATITVDKLDNVKGAKAPTRIAFETPVSVEAFNNGNGTSGVIAIKSTPVNEQTGEVRDDAPRVTIVATDYEHAINQAKEDKDLAIVFEKNTPESAIDHIVDFSQNVPDGLLKDPLVVKWLRNEWRLVVNSKAEQSGFGDMVTRVAPLATYGTMTSNMLNDTFNQRMGSAIYDNNRQTEPWARIYHNDFGQNDEYRAKVTGLQVGYRVVNPTERGQYIHSFAMQRDTHRLDFPLIEGTGKMHGTLLDYYYTDIRKSGHYTDVTAKIGRLHSEYDVAGKHGTVHGSYHNNVFATGIEYGLKTQVGGHGYIQPQAHLQYTYLTGTDYTAATAKVHLRGVHSLVGRVGMNLGVKVSDKTDVYTRVNVLHEFTANQVITAADITTAGAPITATMRNRATWYTFGFGITHQLPGSTRTFIDIERIFGNDYKQSFRLNAGAQFTF